MEQELVMIRNRACASMFSAKLPDEYQEGPVISALRALYKKIPRSGFNLLHWKSVRLTNSEMMKISNYFILFRLPVTVKNFQTEKRCHLSPQNC
jgi:hypothetical protein